MSLERLSRMNLLESREEVDLEQYLATYGSRVVQESEKLFLRDFLYPLLGKTGIKYVVPQYPFIDSSGRLRRIDFALIKENVRVALEVNGETYHAEGIIPNETFDDNLQRQNEIIEAGWVLQRFSYNQLQDPNLRENVRNSLHKIIAKNIPQVISEDAIQPKPLQTMALEALDFYRGKGWTKGIVVLPTGTGKTFLSAFDAKKFDGRVLFVVHRLDILSQSKDAFEKVWPKAKLGLLTGDVEENIQDCDVLFASKDTLRNPKYLSLFQPEEFNYLIVDEVHHGQAPTYHSILKYFQPKNFALGMTATPDRMDRKDIFELFDYNKVFEYTLNDAIEQGFLVPYTYYGLRDNIDYSMIRHNGQKYNIQDLDRYLIIERRNEQILKEYLEKANGGKAIGFCCSVNHANTMAAFFSRYGIPSVAITSESRERDVAIEDFRKNKYAVAFTVDLFNEGMDFPDVRALLFIRPTESKTVFMQQLGRGLRLCIGKDRVVVLDFIGNYKKANKIRQYLGKSMAVKRNDSTHRIEKIVYEYSPNCEVHFDAEVEEILDNQDKVERGVAKEDLVDAYYVLAEKLERKPTQDDINQFGEFKAAKYLSVYDSWVKFLREIGQFTEASYHYPQGVHLGHILFILKIIKEGNTGGTHLDPKYIRLRGELSAEDRVAKFQRQTKYKLLAMMEMGLLEDDRDYGPDETYTLQLTPEGNQFYDQLKDLINRIDLSFTQSEDSVPSWRMNSNPEDFNKQIWEYIRNNQEKKDCVRRFLLETNAVAQMLNYLYRIERKKSIAKASVYSGFFQAPFVKMYCDQNGIDIATQLGAEHRCPFLINILESIGVLEQTRSEINLKEFLVCKQTMQLQPKEGDRTIAERIKTIRLILKGQSAISNTEEESLMKEAFGRSFLTKDFYLSYEVLDSGSIEDA